MRGPSEEILLHIHAVLSDRAPGEVRDLVTSLARHYGVTEKTIYRWANMKGLRWRKSPPTRGQSKISRETALEVASIVHSSRRKSNQTTIPARDAMEILTDSGRRIDASPALVRARMRKERISARDLLEPSPHVTLLSDHPNHVWQFDVTNCIQYFLDARAGLGERDPDMELYQNKIVKTAKTIRKELLRYAVVDHCSGAFYFRYFYASGERAVDGAQFLFEAMRPKDELMEGKGAKLRFHGVPFILVADRGSIMAAKANRALFESLKIDLRLHLPGNPRAKGGVEWLMHYINRFEGRLKLRRAADLDELNAWALDWCIKINTLDTFRDTAPRSALWNMITKEQLRLCPDEKLYRMLQRQPTIRAKANGGCIVRVDGMYYKVPDVNAARRHVTVTRNAYEYPKIDVHFNDRVWLCEPIPIDIFGRLTSGVRYGEYKSPVRTEAQKAKSEIEAIASGWGLSWKGTGDHRIAVAPPAGQQSPLLVFGHQAAKVGNIEHLSKAGVPLEPEIPAPPVTRPVLHSAHEVPRTVITRTMPVMDFLRQLKDEIGPLTPAMNRSLKKQFPDGVPVDDAPALMEQIKGGWWHEGGKSVSHGN